MQVSHEVSGIDVVVVFGDLFPAVSGARTFHPSSLRLSKNYLMLFQLRFPVLSRCKNFNLIIFDLTV